MATQSLAIIAVILVMIFMFLRGGRKAGALFSLPLLSVPVFHLTGRAVQSFFAGEEFQVFAVNAAFDIGGFVLGAVLCWIMARAILSRRIKYAYFVTCAVFMGLLAAAYITSHAQLLAV